MSAVDQKRFNALGREWIARFEFNSLCEIEERTGQPFLAIVSPMLDVLNVPEGANRDAATAKAAMGLKMSDLRMVLHQSLLEAQPEVTPKTAGEIIGEMGLSKAVEVIVWAIERGMGKEEGEPAGQGNPPRKKAA